MARNCLTTTRQARCCAGCVGPPVSGCTARNWPNCINRLDTYLRHQSGLSEPVREVCILAVARECDNAFEWAAHEPEALRVGVAQQLIDAIKLRAPSADIEAPFGIVVQLIREAFTARTVSATPYDAALSLLGVRLLIDLVSLAGMYAGTAALLTVFDMQLDAGESHLLPPGD